MTNIYGLFDEEGLLRYVGKTSKCVAERLRAHWYESRGGGASSRLQWLSSLAERPGWRYLDRVSPEEGKAAERYWIALARDYGCVLFNEQNGGGGIAGETVAEVGAKRSVESEAREAKRKCLERVAAMQAVSKQEHEDRQRATWQVRQMRHQQRASSNSLNRGIFESALRDGLIDYFSRRPDATECFLTTDQILVLANQDAIPVDDQREYFRRMSMVKFLGCDIVAHDTWRFPRLESEKRVIPVKTSHDEPRRDSIFEL